MARLLVALAALAVLAIATASSTRVPKGAPAAPSVMPIHTLKHRLNIHATPPKQNQCYQSFQRLLGCPALRTARDSWRLRHGNVNVGGPETSLNLDPRDVAAVMGSLKGTGIQFAIPPNMVYENDCILPINRQRLRIFQESDTPRLTYILLRSLAMTSIQPNAFFLPASSSDGQTPLDIFLGTIVYNIAATGWAKNNEDVRNFFDNDFAPLATTPGLFTRDYTAHMPFDSARLRAVLKIMIDDPTAKFEDCRRVAYTLTSMEIAKDLTLQQQKETYALIAKVAKIVTGVLSAGAAALPVAGPAAAALFGVIGNIVTAVVTDKANLQERTAQVINVILTVLKGYVTPPDTNMVAEVVGKISDKLDASTKILSGQIGSVSDNVKAILGRGGGQSSGLQSRTGTSSLVPKKGPGRFSSFRFAASRAWSRDPMSTIAYEFGPTCTMKVKEMLKLIYDMLENPPTDAAADTKSDLWSKFESCVPTTKDGGEVGHVTSVMALYKVAGLFVEVPKADSVTAGGGEGILSAVKDGIIDGIPELTKATLQSIPGATQDDRDKAEAKDTLDAIAKKTGAV